MKKMFTLLAGLLVTVAIFAADRRPAIMLNNNTRQFKVVIDGRSYFGDNIRIDLGNFYGYGNNRNHTIKVYEMRAGYFQRERLVDATNFYIGKRDVMINIDRLGRISIQEFKDRGRDRSKGGDDQPDRDNRDRDDRRNRF